MRTTVLRSTNRRFVPDNKARMSEHKNNQSLIKKNFGLLESEFFELKSEMIQGNDILFEETFLNHFEDAMNYLINKFKANRDNAYDTTMNVLIEFRERILTDKVKYGNLKFMFTQMCSQRYQRMMGKTLDEDDYSRTIMNNDPVYDEEMYQLLDVALDKMGENCQDIIKDVYYQKIPYKDLESKYSITAAALRKQKERCITKLKMLLRQTLNA